MFHTFSSFPSFRLLWGKVCIVFLSVPGLSGHLTPVYAIRREGSFPTSSYLWLLPKPKAQVLHAGRPNKSRLCSKESKTQKGALQIIPAISERKAVCVIPVLPTCIYVTVENANEKFLIF